MKRELLTWAERYPEEYEMAEKIARNVALEINALPRPKSATVDYWRQGVLEGVIESLQRRV